MCYLYATKRNVLFLKGMKYPMPESLQLCVEREGGRDKILCQELGGSKASEVFAVL